MVGAIGSSLPAFLGGSSAGRGSAASAPIASPFGPDFLVSLIGSGGTASGAAYNAYGQSASIPANSAAGRQRTAALDQARQALQAGDSAGVRAAIEPLLKRDPGDSIAAYYLGRAYLKEGNLAKAEQSFVQAAAATNDDRITADLRAVRTLKRGSDAAVAQITRLLGSQATAQEGARLAAYVLDVDPANVGARVALADFYERLGKFNLASAEFDDILSNVPKESQSSLISRLERYAKAHDTDAYAQDLLARAYAAGGKLDEAKNAFKTAQRLARNDTELQQQIKNDFAAVYSRQGKDLLAIGREDEARVAFQNALDLAPDDSRRKDLFDLEFAAAERELRAGRLNNALDRLDAARANAPVAITSDQTKQLIANYENLAGRFTTAGDLKRVVAARNGAYQLDSGNETRKRGLADANDIYGSSLADAGDYRAAIKQFRAALKLYSDDINYASHLADAFSHLS